MSIPNFPDQTCCETTMCAFTRIFDQLKNELLTHLIIN